VRALAVPVEQLRYHVGGEGRGVVLGGDNTIDDRSRIEPAVDAELEDRIDHLVGSTKFVRVPLSGEEPRCRRLLDDERRHVEFGRQRPNVGLVEVSERE
jgi:hypothetical protein